MGPRCFAHLCACILLMEPPVGSSSCDMELSLAWSKMDLIIPKLKLTGCDNLVINSNKCDKHRIHEWRGCPLGCASTFCVRYL